jgi:hypothetical protein
MTGSGTENDEKKRFAPWTRPATKPTNEQELTMMTEALNIGLNTVMKQHTYIHNNEIRVQKKGGAIGLELTGALAQAVMVWWDKQFISKAADLQLNHHMYKRYVDDVNVCVTALPTGAKLNINNDAIIMPENKDTPDDKTTMEIMQQLANNIHPSIQMEIDKAFTDPVSGARIMIHYPRPTYEHGSVNPQVGQGGLT